MMTKISFPAKLKKRWGKTCLPKGLVAAHIKGEERKTLLSYLKKNNIKNFDFGEYLLARERLNIRRLQKELVDGVCREAS